MNKPAEIECSRVVNPANKILCFFLVFFYIRSNFIEYNKKYVLTEVRLIRVHR